MSQPWPKIAVITPGRSSSRYELRERALALYAVGMRMLVLREPELTAPSQAWLIQELGRACPELRLVHHLKCPGTKAMLETNAMVVHLPGHARPRELAGLEAFGVSVHDQAELKAAEEAKASYAMLAPIWSPNSKPQDRRPTLGPEGYEEVLASTTIPLFALGGVEASRCARWKGDASVRVALIGRLFQSDLNTALNDFERLQLALEA